MYDNCRLCPNACGVDRHVKAGVCGQKDVVRIAWSGLHRGEEPPVSGRNGAGMVFFTGCPLGCRFCQNWQISSGDEDAYGMDVTLDELAEVFLQLQSFGAASLDLVTGTHFIPSIAEALDLARGRGFSLPVVWNSSGYESVEGLEIIDPYVDLYLVDVKTYDRQVARTFCGRERYVDSIDGCMDFITTHHPHTDLDMLQGTLVRHLVFPGTLAATRSFIRRFARRYRSSCALSLMVQFIPPKCDVSFDPISDEEYDGLIDLLDECGIEDGFVQDRSDDDILWIPDFTKDVPFPASFADALPYFLDLRRSKLS